MYRCVPCSVDVDLTALMANGQCGGAGQESTMPEGRQHDEGPLRPRSVVSVYKLDNVFRHT